MRRRALHLGFPLDAERIGQPDEIIEDADDVRGRDDRFFAPALAAQSLDVRVDDLVGSERQLLGVLAQRAVARLDRRRAEVRFDLFDQRGVGVLETEKLSVDFRSIFATAGARGDHGDHLTLLAGQRALVPHHFLEEIEKRRAVLRVGDEQTAHLRRELHVRVGPAHVARCSELRGAHWFCALLFLAGIINPGAGLIEAGYNAER